MAKKQYELGANDEVRESTDNTCHQTTNGFSPWFATMPSGYTFGDAQPTFNSTTSKWTWYVEGSGVSANAESGASTASATSATFTFTDGEGEGATKTFTATRFAAVESTENENFVTKSYVASQFSRDNTSLTGTIEGYCPYALGTFTSGGELAQGQIKSIAPTADPTDNEIGVVLDFDNSATVGADAVLYVDASASALTANITLDLSAKASGVTYTFVGDTGYATATKGKKCLFCFTRIAATTIVVNKKEY